MNSVFQYYNLEQIRGKQVVCFGCLEAKEFALRLLGQEICFDYFLYLGEDKYCLPHFMNKKVISIEQLKLFENFVVVASYKELNNAYQTLSRVGMERYIVEIERIQPVLSDTSNLIIYGTGGRASRVFKSICGYVDVKGFCDSNIDKSGTYFYDKPIINVSELSEYPKDTCIIIGSTYYDEIKNILRQHGIDEVHIFYMEYDLTIFSEDGHKVTYKIMPFIDLIRDCKNRRVFMYGEGSIVQKMSKIFLISLGLIPRSLLRNKLKRNLVFDTP